MHTIEDTATSTSHMVPDACSANRTLLKSHDTRGIKQQAEERSQRTVIHVYMILVFSHATVTLLLRNGRSVLLLRRV